MDQSQPSKATLLAAWIVVLLTSLLPKVILQELFGQDVTPDLQAAMSLSVIVIALLATVVWQPLRALRQFLVLFLVLIGGQWLVLSRIDQLPVYRTWLRNPSFGVSILAELSLNLIVTLVMIAALVLMKKQPPDFYLVRGNIAAPAEPIRWLGVGPGERWNRLGTWLTFFISLGTLAFLVIAGRPPLDLVVRALPFLPVVLLAAALNAFNEEVTHKASFLSVLEGPVGPRQAVVHGGSLFWHRPLLRRAIRRRGCVAGDLLGLDPGPVDAGDARAVLGLIHPLLARCVDLLLHGYWGDHPWRRVRGRCAYIIGYR